eukprot:TRINITY_DN83421_c0_g1_i1.p1 TRINITY_DN83421_c0_g1~~TRINITY_DN83421_c0_g1_i1.p1  ORF type:complete len:605 (+),score=122.94 TRINITY_DN83421_c0_g1_i1:73-1887(+)
MAFVPSISSAAAHSPYPLLAAGHERRPAELSRVVADAPHVSSTALGATAAILGGALGQRASQRWWSRRCRRRAQVGRFRSLRSAKLARAATAAADSAERPQPYFVLPRRKVPLGDTGLQGDVVEAEVLGIRGAEAAACLLSTGLSGLAVAPAFAERAVQCLSGPAGSSSSSSSAVPGGMRIRGRAKVGLGVDATHVGVLLADGWQAQCKIPWERWVQEAAGNGGRLQGKVGADSGAFIEWTVLPSETMNEEQRANLVGFRAREYVEGTLDMAADGSGSFTGKGAVVDRPGLFSCAKQYNWTLSNDGALLTETNMKLELQRRVQAATSDAKDDLVVPGITEVSFYKESEWAAAATVRDAAVDAVLGQRPLFAAFDVDVDPASPEKLPLYYPGSATRLAVMDGLVEVLTVHMPLSLLAVRVSACGLEGGQSESARRALRLPELDDRPTAPAMLASGLPRTCLNWSAAEALFGFTKESEEVKAAPCADASAVAAFLQPIMGSEKEKDASLLKQAPVMKVQLAMVAEKARIEFAEVEVLIHDFAVFDAIPCEDPPESGQFHFGREEKGTGFLGLGTPNQRPALLLGEDILSQKRYLISSASGRLFVAS